MKAMSRRLFGRVAAAAPLAAPSLVSKVSNDAGMPPIMSGAPAQAFDEMKYLAETKSRLTRHAAGIFDEEDDVHDASVRQIEIATHYDALRSLSPVRRAQMFDDAMRRERRKMKTLWARLELPKVIKRLMT